MPVHSVRKYLLNACSCCKHPLEAEDRNGITDENLFAHGIQFKGRKVASFELKQFSQ